MGERAVPTPGWGTVRPPLPAFRDIIYGNDLAEWDRHLACQRARQREQSEKTGWKPVLPFWGNAHTCFWPEGWELAMISTMQP